MLNKEDVAAVMATGDADTKISLLKKAVVSVTKQKQMLEQHNQQLQSQMATIGEELSNAQEECASLQRRLKTTEAELEEERRRRHFVKSTWKGLSSLVTGADSAARGKPPLSLSSEDQEKLVAENESLHMQLFDTRTRLDDTCRARDSENAQREREVLDLRAHLNAATQACDSFHAESARDATLAQFCLRFFVPAWAPRRGRLTLRPAVPLPNLPPDSCGEAVRVIASAIAALRALQGGSAALFAALRDSAPHGTGRHTRDRLTTLLDAHAQSRRDSDDAARALDDAVQRGACAETVAARQEDVLAAADEWLALVALHARLLACACADTCACAEVSSALGEECVAAFSAARGAIAALRHVCRGAGAVLRVADSTSAADWVIALERFWWTGCADCTTLRDSSAALAARVDELSEKAPGDALRAALLFVSRALRTAAVPHARAESPPLIGLDGAENESEENNEAAEAADAGERDELLEALAAADRAAVCYHAQMRHALAELAAAQAALGAEREGARRAKAAADERADDAERVREALETQVSILSERLVEAGGGAQ